MATTTSILKLIRGLGFQATSAPTNTTPPGVFTVAPKVREGRVWVNLADHRHLSKFASYRDFRREGAEAEARWTERFCAAGYTVSAPVDPFLGADGKWHIQRPMAGLYVA